MDCGRKKQSKHHGTHAQKKKPDKSGGNTQKTSFPRPQIPIWEQKNGHMSRNIFMCPYIPLELNVGDLLFHPEKKFQYSTASEITNTKSLKQMENSRRRDKNSGRKTLSIFSHLIFDKFTKNWVNVLKVLYAFKFSIIFVLILLVSCFPPIINIILDAHNRWRHK